LRCNRQGQIGTVYDAAMPGPQYFNLRRITPLSRDFRQGATILVHQDHADLVAHAINIACEKDRSC